MVFRHTECPLTQRGIIALRVMLALSRTGVAHDAFDLVERFEGSVHCIFNILWQAMTCGAVDLIPLGARKRNIYGTADIL